MTNQILEAPVEVSSSMDERIEILARELELAVKWQRPCILLVVYSSEYVRADVENALENYLMDLGQKAVRLQLKHQPTESVLSFLREFRDPANAVFLVNGLHWGQQDGSGVYSTLNLQREFFVERQIRAVFWMTQNEIMNLARFAPDFWAYRHRVIEFAESPKGERLLQKALESAWQGTGEYGEPYEDTDARITLRESMLTELPDGEEASSLRANLLLTLGILNWRKGDFEKAGEQLQDALRLAAKMEDNWFEAECYNALALIRSSTERTDEAIDAYKQAIHLAPDQIFAWNNLGNLCVKIGRNDEAMIAFRKAVECNPKDPIAWNGLANLHFRLGYVDDAVAAYRKAVEYMPSFAQPWNGLGDVYASMGRFDEAMKAYHKSIELNKQYVTPWIRLGVLYTRQERYREAAKAYQRALALDPHNSRAWNELGLIYIKSEALEDAAEAFHKAIELDRGFGWAYSNLAYACILQGKCKETVSLLIRSIELFTTDKEKAVSWNRLGNAYRLLNDYDNAIAAYQMADQLDRGSSEARFADPESVLEEQPVAEEPDAQPAAAEAAEEQPVLEVDKPEDPESPAQEPIQEPEVAEPAALPAVDEPVTRPAQRRAAQEIEAAPAWLFPHQGEHPASGMEQAIDAAEDGGSVQKREVTADGAGRPPSEAATPSSPEEPKEAEANYMDACKWNEEGNACFKRGAFDDAISAYEKAIQLDPLLGLPYSNLALTYLSQGRHAEAVTQYQKSIELLQSDADRAIAWNGLGNAYRRANDYARALAAYQKAAELDPATAGIRDRADDFHAAKRPRDARGWNELGELFASAGSADEAIQAFQRAIELDPKMTSAYNSLAVALVSQRRYQEAIPLYKKSIELLEDNKEKAAVWNRLGNIYRKLNDYDNAIKAYQKAVVLADEGVDLLTRTRFSLLSNCYVNS